MTVGQEALPAWQSTSRWPHISCCPFRTGSPSSCRRWPSLSQRAIIVRTGAHDIRARWDVVATQMPVDCHSNFSTNAAFHLTPDVRPQAARFRLDTTSLRGMFNAELALEQVAGSTPLPRSD